MVVMSDFNEADHPRGGDPTNTGRWSEKGNSAPESILAPPPSPLLETQRRLRGHNFWPRDVHKWPALYSNEGTPLAEQPFVAHYFVGGADWYVSELDHNTGEAFGYADLGFGEGEFGYIDLVELESVHLRPNGFPQVVERDLDFVPGTKAGQVIDKYREEES